MENKFFTFFRPYLTYIDSGRMFKQPLEWLYTLLAVVNLALPLFVAYQAVDGGIFNAPTKGILLFFFCFTVLAFASWFGFQLWWSRKSKVNPAAFEGSEFIVTPVLSHFVQTVGEWIGTWIGIVGFCFGLLSILLPENATRGLTDFLGIGFMDAGFNLGIMSPVYGFMIVLISRFFSEQMKALATIATSTAKR